MSDNEKNVPKRRFKEFENAEGWEQRKLKDVSTYSNGGSFENDVQEKGRYELITLKSVDMGGNLVHSGRYVDIEVPTLTKGTLVMVLSEQSPGLLGMTAQIPKDNTYILNQRVAEIRPNQRVDSYFLSMAINKNQPYFSRCGAGTKVQNISKSNVENYEFLCPLLQEQQKIGQFFTTINTSITLHQRKLDKMKALKKAYLTGMFPAEGERKPKLRFTGFTDDWEQRKFSDVVNTRRGLTYTPADIKKDGIMVLRSSNIDEDQFILKDDDVFVAQNAINIDYAKENDILITSANGSPRLVGKHALISNINNNTAVHGGFMLLATTNEPYFINASMSSNWYKKFIDLYVSGGNGSIGNLSKSDLDNQKILLPDKGEQVKIGTFFQHIDTLITLHQNKLEKLQNIKKAYLNEMFI